MGKISRKDNVQLWQAPQYKIIAFYAQGWGKLCFGIFFGAVL
jgi:hypothetical protein